MKFIKTNNISTLIKRDNKVIESQIIAYLVYMQEQKLSYSAKNVRLSALRKFYDMNDIVKLAKDKPISWREY